MLLSDGTLLSRICVPSAWDDWQRLVVEPFDEAQLQPCSIDVHLGDEVKMYHGLVTDTRADNSRWWRVLKPTGADEGYDAPECRAWVLEPGHFYLAVLRERIVVPEDCCGQLVGISSRARDGVTIHQQAGLLDPGWRGRATLEMTVENPHTVLYAGMRIGQVEFQLLDHRARVPYRGRYQDDDRAQPARPDESRQVASSTTGPEGP